MTDISRIPKGKPSGSLRLSKARWNKENMFLYRLFPDFCARTEYFLLGKLREKAYKNQMDRFYDRPVPPWFSIVEIETVNRCNGSCSFCPVNRHAPQRPMARMSESLFESIIGQLEAIGYAKTVNLHSNNEPLLDARLPEFAAHAKSRLPKAQIKLFTNGVLLNVDLFRKLMPHLDRMMVNNYSHAPKMIPSVQSVYDFCLTPEGRELIAGKELYVQLRSPNVVLSSRGGGAPNRKPPSKATSAKCVYPFKQFVVRPDGCVSLCCNDALGAMTLGDLKRESLSDIWRGEAYAKVRKTLAERGRKGIPLCAACDFVKPL